MTLLVGRGGRGRGAWTYCGAPHHLAWSSSAGRHRGGLVRVEEEGVNEEGVEEEEEGQDGAPVAVQEAAAAAGLGPRHAGG